MHWTQELREATTEARRQELLQLRTLAQLMDVSASSRTISDKASAPASTHRQWGALELRECIGAGNFGSVHRAWDPKLEREVAVKLLDRDRPDRTALLAEARHSRSGPPSHRGACPRRGRSRGHRRLPDGTDRRETLSQRLKEHGPYGAAEAVAVGVSLCRALAAIHRVGLVHQDVKAQNVMRETDGRLVLMDFGAGVPADAGMRPR